MGRAWRKFAVFLFALLALSARASAEWWEQGRYTWYYKDDWRAQFIRGGGPFRKTFRLDEPVRVAYLQVWAREYRLLVNDVLVGEDADVGTIENYDITKLLRQGENTIVLDARGEAIAEGELVLRSGRTIAIRTDASWGKRGTRASRERASGPRGYMGNCHNALIPTYTAEQKLKARVNYVLAVKNRLALRDLLVLHERANPAALAQPQSPELEMIRRVRGDIARLEALGPEAVAAAKRALASAEVSPALGRVAEYENVAREAERRAEIFAQVMDLRAEIASLWHAATVCKERAGDAPQEAVACLYRAQKSYLKARRAAAQGGSLESIAAALSAGRSEAQRARELLERQLGLFVDPINVSRRNRLGWVTTTLLLGNDPLWWEFSLAPAGWPGVELQGLWRFSLDPENRGESARWPARAPNGAALVYAPAAWEWQGFVQDNPRYPADCPFAQTPKFNDNKPYNGFAWYWKALRLPEAWRVGGAPLKLYLGKQGNGCFWLYVNGRLHGEPPEGFFGYGEAAEELAPDELRWGKENLFALRLYNLQNLGGIIEPPLMLCRAGSEPQVQTAPAGCAVFRRISYPVPARRGGARRVTLTFLCSALSPAAVVLCDDAQLRLSGWRARGWRPPDALVFATAAGVRAVPFSLAQGPATIAGSELGENWLLLWPTRRGADRPRPLLLVMERRPQSVALAPDELGETALVLRFSQAPARLLMLRLPARSSYPSAPDSSAVAECRMWSRALLRYPTGYAEMCRPGREGERAEVVLRYEYLELRDDWGTEPLELAPLPTLLSYARATGYPGVDVQGEVAFLGEFSGRGRYLATEHRYEALLATNELCFTFRQLGPDRLYKGVGFWTAPEEQWDEQLAQVRSWGANSTRPQLVFHGGRFRMMAGLLGELTWPEESLARLDRYVALHQKHGLHFCINWFWNADRPIAELGGAFANSSRCWRKNPCARQLIIDFWKTIAQRYRDLPPRAVGYDLLNEPAYVFSDDWNSFARAATAAIRSVDRTHPIYIEAGNGWAQPEDFDTLHATGDENTLYSFHFYGPHHYDVFLRDVWYPRFEGPYGYESRAALEERLLAPLRFAIRNRAQLHHGEFGVSPIAPGDSHLRWLDDLLGLHEKHRIHWSYWHYSGREIYRTGLVAGKRLSPNLAVLRRYWAREGE